MKRSRTITEVVLDTFQYLDIRCAEFDQLVKYSWATPDADPLDRDRKRK